MNESTVSSDFQTRLRRSGLNCVVLKHADKSMVGMPDATVTAERQTLWLEYKIVTPNRNGDWSAVRIAENSPKQFGMMRDLACCGRALYIFWVVDHLALRKRVGSVVLWHPLTQRQFRCEDTAEAVFRITQIFRPQDSTLPEALKLLLPLDR